MSLLKANLAINYGLMIGEKNTLISYEYNEACVDHVPYGNRSVAMNTKPSIYVHSAIIVTGGKSNDMSDHFTGDGLRRLHNEIIEENHL